MKQTVGSSTFTQDSTTFDMTHDLTVPDEAYGAGWNGSLEVPTKNAVYDKIETIGGASGWLLVDSQAFSGATTATINNDGSNLDGNTDEIYELVVRGVWAGGAEGNLGLRLNGDSSSIYFYTNPYGTEAGAQSVATGALDTNVSLTNGSHEHIFVKVTIYAKTAYNKMVVGTATGFDTSSNTMRTTHIGGVYEESSTNVTSMTLVSSANFAAGSQWWLWKKGTE